MIDLQDYNFNHLIENTCTLIGVMDHNWTLEKINFPWSDVLHYEVNELLDKKLDVFFYDLKKIKSLKQKLKKEKKLQGQVINLMNKKGEPCWIKCNLGYDKDKIIILGIDVTEDVFTSQTLNHVSDVALIAAWGYNPKLEKVSWSKEFYNLLDMDEDDEISKNTFYDAIHPSYFELYKESSDKLWQTKKGYDINIKIITKKGSVKWVRSITYPNIVDNQIVYVQGIIKDITNIQNIVIEITQLKNMMKMALKGMKSGFFIHNIISNTVSYSKSFRKLIGFKNDIKEENFRKLIHPKDVDDAYARHVKALQSKGQNYYNHYRLKWSKNVYKYYEVHGWRVRDEEGKVIKLIGNLIDVDKRVRLKKKSESYANQIETLLDVGNMSSVLLDKKGMILMADDASVKIIRLEFGHDIVNNKTAFKKIIPKHKRAEFLKDFKRLQKGKKVTKEMEHTGLDGKSRWFEANYSPVINQEGDIEGYVMNYFNITKRKLLLNELMQTKNKLQEINRLKSNIISNINHEIRTPLNGIMGAAELLKTTTDKEEQVELLEMQEESGQRLMQTVNSIINYSLIDAERKSYAIGKIDLKIALKNCYERFLSFANKNNVNYNIQNFDISIFIKSDNLMIQQCIGNVIHNAIKFSKNGNVTIKCSSNNTNAKIIIEDDGVGIEDNNYDKIFEYFEQESNGLDRDYEGAGMGLSFSKKFLKVIGGNIILESKKNVGSKFILTIPLKSQTI